MEKCFSLFEEVTKRLIAKKLSITTMESCTSGMIASLLTDTEGASAVLKGAYVTYSNAAKIKCGVPAQAIEHYGVYSAETARAMAEACRNAYEAEIGIGITGSFGNVDPANADSVPGEIHLAISFRGEMHSYFISGIPQSSRREAKLFAAEKTALALLHLIG